MAKTFTAAGGYTQLDLVQFSRDHLFAAQKLFNLDVRTLDSAGYLAQLGIELLLKVLPLTRKRGFLDQRRDSAVARRALRDLEVQPSRYRAGVPFRVSA
jgi:hypothetical protein